MRDEFQRKLKELEPHLGAAKARRLRLAYSLSSREERDDFETLINALHERNLQGADDEIVLPPPPPASVGGEYPVGEILYPGLGKPIPFALDQKRLVQHLAVFGRSGGGKSTFLFNLLGRVVAQEGSPPCWMIDWKRDYRGLFQDMPGMLLFTVGRPVAPLCWNPLLPPKGLENETSAYLERMIDIIARAFYLGHGCKSILKKGMHALLQRQQQGERGALTLRNLLHWTRDYEPGKQYAGRRALDWKESTLRALEALAGSGEFAAAINTPSPLPLDELVGKSCIFELDALSRDQKVFFTESLIHWLRAHAMQRLETRPKDRMEMLLAIEEVHHILKGGRSEENVNESVLEEALRETRSLGIGFVIVDQCPSMVNRVIASQAHTAVFFSLKGRADVKAAADALLLDRDQEAYLGRLPVGRAICKMQSGWFDPFLIQVPYDPRKDAVVGDREVAELMGRRLAGFAGDSIDPQTCRPEEPEPPTMPTLPDREIGGISLTINERELLLDVARRPLSGVAARWKRLKVSTRNGGRLKESLIEHGYLLEQEISLPKGKALILGLTDRGRQALQELGYGVEAAAKGAGNIAHEFWKQKVRRHYERLGYEVDVENPIGEGRNIDLVARKGSLRIAIEVETGSNHRIRDLEELVRYDKIIFATTNQEAYDQVKRLLEQQDPVLRERCFVVEPKRFAA
jgi:hypothetical protein